MTAETPAMADAPATLVDALVAIQGHLPVLAKDKAANYGRYADLVQLHAVVLPLLVEHGLCWTCCPTITEAGQPVLEYTLRHASGETIGGRYPLPSAASPQQFGSGLTYARRYALCAVLGVVADADDDGAAAEVGATKRRPAARRPSTQDGVSRETVSAKADPAPTEAALKRMFASFNDAGIRDKDGQLNLIEEVTGRRVESRKEMTAAEVSAVTRMLVDGASEAKEHDR